MRYFQDTGVLLLYGLFALLYKDVDIAFVFGFLCALILLCFAWFIEVRWLCLAGGIVFTAVALAVPSLVFFSRWRCIYLSVSMDMRWRQSVFL